MSRTFSNKSAFVVASLLAAIATPALAQFRVNPYLQQPSTDGMLFNWFTTTNTPGSISISGPGLLNLLTVNSTPTREFVLDYVAAEDTQNISGLTQGSWLVGGPTARDNNYKHSVDVRSLQAGQTYNYTVTQGNQTFTRPFRTAPSASNWHSVRFVAMADSEIEPLARNTRTQWAPGAGAANRPALNSAFATKFGTSTLNGANVLRYALTESEGFTRNLSVVDSRDPDFVVMPGDIVQGGGYQPGWDEFFRHQAGEFGDNLTKRPLIATMGNWETFSPISGGYSTSTTANPVGNGPRFGRMKYKTYIDAPSNGTANHQDNYHRVDYGPVTIITLDSTNGGSVGGANEDARSNYPTAQKLTGRQYTGTGTDTQENYNVDAYNAGVATDPNFTRYNTPDLSDFNPGSPQWNWARTQLADARSKNQIVFVQYHHTAYSSGEHGLPMNHADSSGQGGTPMRQYQSMFEEFGVSAVLSGHSEMFERSFVDLNGDGIGVHHYDVGISADGLRGARRLNAASGSDFYTRELLNYNPFSQWTADQSAPEKWELDANGVLQLVDGGKHYGHLEVNVERLLLATLTDGSGANIDNVPFAKVTLTPVYNFPVLDSNYNLLRTERRVYGDEIVLILNAQGQVIPEPATLGLIVGASALVLRRKRR